MTEPTPAAPHTKENVTRRNFMQRSAGSAAATAAGLQIVRPQALRGDDTEKLSIGIVGCGGRGTRGVAEAIRGNPNYELHAMGDLFEDQLERSLRRLRDSDEFPAEVKQQIKVAPENRYLGYDAYKKVVDSGVDVVFLHTPPGWRPLHLEYALNANKHVFAEKPLATDMMGAQKVIRLAKESEQKKLTVMIGAQRRSQKEYVESVQRIQDGEIGDVVATYANWISGPVIKGADFMERLDQESLAWQQRAWYSHVWICGDQIVEQHLHNIDVINWVLGDTHPVSVVASGGAVWRPREKLYGNIYDHVYADFEYANGVRMSSHCRQYPERKVRRVNELVVGTRGRSTVRDLGTPSQTSPYVQEHIDMVKSINGSGPYKNQALAVAYSTMTAIMGRESAYAGIEVTWDMAMNSKQNLIPDNPSLNGKHDVTELPRPGEYEFI
ncbi:MAG: Gfo/Idh/MocA family oxidoreductase [Acidobacteriia bacterium]|nr:Gfo/Idh/MocA family oxidoreductase [Terriglobia bacterium]MYG03966.1 Gfo/Idh/MocA family oxidoreductase [Terriglobia bacterium]MYK10394.1 Gfo/Idh/MocA family oxidoreductase [Terriglobia bacterium]